MTTQFASKISVLCILTIVAVCIGGQFTSRRAKREVESAIKERSSELWSHTRERDCDWFLKLGIHYEDKLGMDEEKRNLYSAYAGACLSLVNLQPEKDVEAEMERKDNLGKKFHGKDCQWFYRQMDIEPGKKNMDSEKINLFAFLGQLCEKQPETPE